MWIVSHLLQPGPAAAPPDPADPAASHPAAAVARRLDMIFTPLLALVAAQFHSLGTLASPVWTRISRTRERLLRLLAHLAAGRAPRPARTPAAVTPATAPRQPGVRVAALRWRHGWLGHRLDHNVRGLASQLDHLLREPGVAELIAASPGAARTLRPLCRMLGVALPEPLRPPPLPPKPLAPKPRPAGPADTPPAPPDRPLQPYVLAAARAWKRRDEKIR